MLIRKLRNGMHLIGAVNLNAINSNYTSMKLTTFLFECSSRHFTISGRHYACRKVSIDLPNAIYSIATHGVLRCQLDVNS